MTWTEVRVHVLDLALRKRIGPEVARAFMTHYSTIVSRLPRPDIWEPGDDSYTIEQHHGNHAVIVRVESTGVSVYLFNGAVPTERERFDYPRNEKP